MVLLHTVSLQQRVRLPLGGRRGKVLKVHGRQLRLEEGRSTNQSPVEKAPGAAPTQGSCNVYRGGDMVMQLKLFFFFFLFFFASGGFKLCKKRQENL